MTLEQAASQTLGEHGCHLDTDGCRANVMLARAVLEALAVIKRDPDPCAEILALRAAMRRAARKR
jgi:hypothetical protein